MRKLHALNGPLEGRAFEVSNAVGDLVQLRGASPPFKINPFHEDAHDALDALSSDPRGPINPITAPVFTYLVTPHGLRHSAQPGPAA